MKAELIENRIIVWNISDSRKLFTAGYYGKPIGMPKPKPDEINVPLILDLIEGYYLQLNSKIQIYKNKKKISDTLNSDTSLKEMIVKQTPNDAVISIEPTNQGVRIYGKWKNGFEFGVSKELFEIYNKIAGHIKNI